MNGDIFFYAFFLLLVLLIAAVTFFYRKISHYKGQVKNLPEENAGFAALSFSEPNLKKEREKFDTEKKSLEEKNTKLWNMSETVYKEKRKVEELYAQLKGEKDKLEDEKKKFQEKTKKLWQQSIAIHKEKDRIDTLKKEVERKHQDIIDSINYAKNIQEAILTSEEYLRENLPEHFIFYKPRDIVSGDFYWSYKTKEGKIFFLCADSTGHGVPGAFMSMIGNALIDEVVIEKNIHKPDEILNEMRKGIIKALKQRGHAGEQKDGMDGAIICLTPSENGINLTASCANNPVWVFKSSKAKVQSSELVANNTEPGTQNSELFELAPDRQPISINYEMSPFSLHETILQQGDTVYMMTDGYEDQFGGAKGKKFKAAKLKEILLSVQDKSMLNQKSILEKTFQEWQGNFFQVDDVLLVGIRI